MEDFWGAKYILDDRYFASDLLNKGRSFKKFFTIFTEKIFKINLKSAIISHKMNEESIVFPLIYPSEKYNYSAISYALYEQFDCVISEFAYKSDCKFNQRFIDFVAFNENLSIAMEVKRIDLEYDKNLRNNTLNIISNGFLQLYDMQKTKSIRFSYDFKILFVICPIWVKKSKKSLDKLKTDNTNLPKKLLDNIATWLDGRRNSSVLCATLDMRECIYGDKILPFEGENIPYIMLFAIVLGNKNIKNKY